LGGNPAFWRPPDILDKAKRFWATGSLYDFLVLYRRCRPTGHQAGSYRIVLTEGAWAFRLMNEGVVGWRPSSPGAILRSFVNLVDGQAWGPSINEKPAAKATNLAGLRSGA
jgi:hypothetical protein